MLSARDVLRNILNDGDYEGIGRAIAIGYKACDEFMGSNPAMANFLIGMDHRSRLISVFVEYALTKVDNFTYEMKPNAARNCWHTRFYKTNKLAMTVHFLGRGKKIRKIPRKAMNRAQLADRNYDLFADEAVMPDVSDDQFYGWITHAGFMKPSCAGLVIPCRDQSTIYAATDIPLVVPANQEVEQVREELAIKLLTTADNENESKAG